MNSLIEWMDKENNTDSSVYKRVPIIQLHQANDMDWLNPTRWMVGYYYLRISDNEIIRRKRYILFKKRLIATIKGWKR